MRPTSPRPSIQLTIDEVVLRGVRPEQAHDVLAHLEARLVELANQWSPVDAPLHDRAESSRRLPVISAPAESAAAIGASVADAVWTEIGGTHRGGAR